MTAAGVLPALAKDTVLVSDFWPELALCGRLGDFGGCG